MFSKVTAPSWRNLSSNETAASPFTNVGFASDNLEWRLSMRFLNFFKLEAGKLKLEEKVPFNRRFIIRLNSKFSLIESNGKTNLTLSGKMGFAPPRDSFYWRPVWRLKQILNNLLSNFIQFTLKGKILVSW